MLQEATFVHCTILPHNLEERLPLPASIKIEEKLPFPSPLWTEENFDFAKVEDLHGYRLRQKWLLPKLKNLKTIQLGVFDSFQELSDLADMIHENNVQL